MKNNRHPHDSAIPRRTRLQPGEAPIIYKLGKAAGEREAHERYWEGYIDGMADAVPPGTSIVVDPTASESDGIPDLDGGPDSERPFGLPDLDDQVSRDADIVGHLDQVINPDHLAGRSRTDRAAIRPCRPTGRRERGQ